ncbi:hypothetical protein SEA_EVAA_78 [Gordonia phage Evaa]|nr:hypothetical protein SEA_EVAA_78 [Gordonia phage Evaa]
MTESPNDIRERARALRESAAILEREAAELEDSISRIPIQPPMKEGKTVTVTFSRTLDNGRTYHYAAVGFRRDRFTRPTWMVTGTAGSERRSWTGLLEFVGHDNWHTLRQVTAATPLHVRRSGSSEPAGTTRFLGRQGMGDFDGCGNGPY